MITVPHLSVAIPISGAITYQYPIEEAIESILHLPKEIIVNVDVSVKDGTLELIKKLQKKDSKIQILERNWNHSKGALGVEELTRQANIAIDACSNDWVLYLEADEGLHEKDFEHIKCLLDIAEKDPNVTGFNITRLCFFGNLDIIRTDWTIPIIRIFRKSNYWFDVDGNNPKPREGKLLSGVFQINQLFYLYHYTRIGDPEVIGKRLKNLDSWFHPKHDLPKEDPAYDFQTRDVDTYSISWNKEGKVNLVDKSTVLISYYDSHPHPFFEKFKKFRGEGAFKPFFKGVTYTPGPADKLYGQ